jgi:hypothetical protein
MIGADQNENFMSEDVQPPGAHEQMLTALDYQERKIRDKWVSFKKRLRADKSLDPDCADQKFREEEAKYEEAMNLISEQREHLTHLH